MNFPSNALDRLADRVLCGEVTFFIGAGFSLDSEGNSATKLITRLISRFEAMCYVLNRDDILQKMFNTFSSSGTPNTTNPTSSCIRKIFIDKLASEYYHINDWICKAFDELQKSIPTNLSFSQKTIENINNYENIFLSEHVKNGILLAGSIMPPLESIDQFVLTLPPPLFGKTLFLDTMGFNNPDIMGGSLDCPTYEDVLCSYGNRLRDRYLVLARLAREGLCHQTTTTNYDLLLEGAYRVSGFEQKIPGKIRPESTRINHFCTIASADDFFNNGHGYQTATIIKIHGCVDQYRKSRTSIKTLKRYLPAMVFTYREIQNWREDAWSRDSLRNLIRTRTMVFCGYSGADPVLHDTFRSVYEEIARRSPENSTKAEKGPAFFTCPKGKREFHGLELLTAASKSRGRCELKLGNHPNYLEFNFLNGTFPDLDELFLWLFHLIFRQRQEEMLGYHLRALVFNNLKGPANENTIKKLLGAHKSLIKKELKIAKGWENGTVQGSICRQQLRRITGWTWLFQTAFLREWETGELMLRRTGPNQSIPIQKYAQWYVPTVYHPERTALGAILEIALRRIINKGRKENGSHWQDDSPWVFPLDHIHPTLSFVPDSNSPKGYQLGIRTAPPSAMALPSIATTNPFSQKTWILNTPHGKWVPNSSDVPNFRKLIDWAVGNFEPEDFEKWLIAKTK